MLSFTKGPRARVLALVPLVALACGKPGVTTTAPGGPEPRGVADAKAVDLRYSELPVTLQQRAKVDFTTTGGGAYAQATLEVGVQLELGGGRDSLEVGWTIVAVDEVSLAGSLAASTDEPQSYVRSLGAGAWQIDRRGVVDLRATDAHPANARRLEALAVIDSNVARQRADTDQDVVPPPGAVLLKLLPNLLVLPRLPAERLEIGVTSESTQTRDTRITGIDLVLEVEAKRRFTVVNVESGAGIRLAEVTYEIDEWGGVDLEDGVVELRNRTHGTMLFDIDRGVPINLSYTREESLEAGEISYDTTKIVSATFERD